MALQQGWQQDVGTRVSKLIARAWLDNNFKRQFIANPARILADAGITIPDGVQVRIDEQSARWSILPSEDMTGAVWTIPLPPKPASVTDQQLTDWVESRVARPAALIPPGCC